MKEIITLKWTFSSHSVAVQTKCFRFWLEFVQSWPRFYGGSAGVKITLKTKKFRSWRVQRLPVGQDRNLRHRRSDLQPIWVEGRTVLRNFLVPQARLDGERPGTDKTNHGEGLQQLFQSPLRLRWSRPARDVQFVHRARSAVEAEMRAKLTPFYILDKISSNLIELINKKLDANGSVELDVKEFSGLYSTDVIASCAFGVEANSMENPEAEFRKVGRQLFELTIKRGLEFTSFFMLSEVTKFFNCKFFTESVTEFITKSITYVMGEREKSGITRNDLIDTLIEIKKSDGEMTMDMLIAQAALFFVAGY